MDNVSILKVKDQDEDQEGCAIVRTMHGVVYLTLSLEHDGDVAVAFTPVECGELVSLLQDAIAVAQGTVQVT